MSILMIRCPQTGQAVSTGIDTDRDSFRKIPEVLGFAYCARCGLEHAWWQDEAWLADGPQSEQAPSIDRPPKRLRAEAGPR
jgi:hypothetical protein